MKHEKSGSAVVVGIDGSTAAIRAAEWAADEAASRGKPLRLIYILDERSEAVRLETEYAESALLTACAAVEAVGQKVKIQTSILRGRIHAVFAGEAQHAGMLVVGAFGAEYPHRKPLGSTPTVLLRSVRCPLEVIRTPHVQRPDCDVIAVIAGGSQQCDSVLVTAMDEARLRKLPLLTLSVKSSEPDDAGTDQFSHTPAKFVRALTQWRHRYPDVKVETAVIGASPAGFLCETSRTIRLMIVDGEERSHIALGTGGRFGPFGDYCSLLRIHPTPR